VTLHDLLLAPAHGLLRQSWSPRLQQHGTVNADGFGAGWWVPERREEPARYRRAIPLWADRSFASLAGVVAAPAVVAAVRSATPPLPVEESGCAPFAAGPWLFSHNGAVEGWASGAGHLLRGQVSAARAGVIEGATDSEVLFALTLDRLDDGLEPTAALAAVVSAVAAGPGGRLNLLLGDGRRVAATRWGDTLFTRAGDDGIVVASEPFDDGDGWEPVPERSVLGAAGNRITISQEGLP
jgi:glutamine amidotransferase